MNNNQSLIDGLRQAADFLESKPDLPNMNLMYGTHYQQTIRLWTGCDKALLREAARHLGSFTKKFTDHYFELHKPINEAVEIEVCIDRETICKKIVTWDCPDEESILELVKAEQQ